MVPTLVQRNVENSNSEVASLGHYATIRWRGVLLGIWCRFTPLQEGFCRPPHAGQHKCLSGCKHICWSLERANLSKRKIKFHRENQGGNTDWANSVPVFHRDSWWEPLFPACIKALSLMHKWHFCQISSVNNFQ